ncbi:MAG: hypothetical protein F6K53_33255, partial [Moorea sp. SIO4A1]
SGVAIAVIVGLITGLFSLIGQRNALFGQIKADRQAAEAKFGFYPDLEALLASLRAAKSIQDWPGYLSLFKPDPKLKIQVTKTLHKVAYGVRERNRLEKHQGTVIGLGISPDDSRIASVDNTGIICLWDRSGKLLNDDCFQGPEGWVESASFNPDVSSLATINTSIDSSGALGRIYTLALWNLETQEQVEVNLGSKFRGWDVVFSQDGEQLATRGSRNDTRFFRYWDLSGQEISENQFKGEPQFSMVDKIYSSDGKIATFPEHKRFPSYYKNTLVLDNPSEPSDITIETNHTWIERAVFSLDGQQLITAGRDGIIRIWDFKSNQVSDSSHNFKVDTSKLSWSSDEVSKDPIDTSLFSECHSAGIIDEVIFSPDNKLRATAARDGTVCLWNLDGKELAQFKGSANGAMEVSFSPDGKLLATAGLDGITKLWDLETKEQVAEFNAESRGQVFDLNFSPDGKQLAMVANDQIVRLWQIESFDQLMVRGCNWVRDYLENNPNVEESDRHLCDNVNK